MMNAEKIEWEQRAKRPGLGSVMSTRWAEDDSVMATEMLKEKIFRCLGCLEKKRLLEVGCGVGRFTDSFQQAGASVVAVDYSFGMIERARKTVRNNFPFINADAAGLPLPDSSFDISVAITVLQHIVDPNKFEWAMAELRRVSNQRIFICDELRPDEPQKVSPFTMLRTLEMFQKEMPCWELVRVDNAVCITDPYTMMLWEKR